MDDTSLSYVKKNEFFYITYVLIHLHFIHHLNHDFF